MSTKEEKAVKIVLLGAPCVGKSTFANLIHSGFFRETYYPTHKSTMLLFDYMPKTPRARAILDEYGPLEAKQCITAEDEILLSPVLFQAYNKSAKPTSEELRRHRSASNSSSSKTNKAQLDNGHYGYHFQEDAIHEGYSPPFYTQIPVELIDTPPFKPHLVVPFLEVSLYRNLDPEDLHNLANEPRRPVSTNPLLVASGASELDGNVSAYIFTYCAVPSLNPPSYDESLTPTSSAESNGIETIEEHVVSSRKNEDTLGVLELVRGAILDAWREYRTYQKKRQKGAEGDVYSLIHSIKQLWKLRSAEEEARRVEELRKISTELEALDMDPSSPDAPPPIVVMCTHAKHAGASPLLIERGRKMASEWGASFVLEDSEIGLNIEETLALVLREIVEREKLQKQRTRR